MGRPVERYAVGCPHPVGTYPAPVHYEVHQGRFAVWRCRDRNCADAQYAKDTGQIAMHAEDRVTGRVTTYFRPLVPGNRQEQE